MIKIIDETPEPEVVKRAVCRNCGVTLEYTPADTRSEIGIDYSGCSDIYTLINCPNCGYEIIL